MATKSKHYTSVEKNFFLQILGKYKNIIECKKSNTNTLRDKEAAWKEICNEYNNSSLITQDRTVQQLKKLWTNLKQMQRDALTKEKQARFATGGGPEVPSAQIDPDIAAIAPNLMATAPVLFTSNMNEEEIENAECDILQDISITNAEDFMEIQINAPKETANEIDEIDEIESQDNALSAKEIVIKDENENSRKIKRKKLSLETETDLKILRIRNIIEKEQQIAQVQLQHEKTIAAMKETHLKELNKLELRASLAKTKLAELLLGQKSNTHIAK